MSDEPDFDLEEVYDREVSPLMAKILDVCKAHGMPMVASFCYRNDGEGGSDLCTSVVPRGDWQLKEFAEFQDRIYRQPSGLVAFTVTKADGEAKS